MALASTTAAEVTGGSLQTKRQLIAMLVVGVMGNSVIYLIPLLVGAMVTDRGFSEQQAGFMASADITGYAVATFISALVLGRIQWRHLALGGVGIMVTANLATTQVYGATPFAAVRFLSGLGAGVLAAIATVSLGQTDKPDRAYGLLFAAALLFATAGLWGLPVVLAAFHLNGAYVLIALLAVATGFAATKLPDGHTAREAGDTSAPRQRWLLAAGILASILIFFADQNAVWAYIERMGNASGLTTEYIGFSLGVATLTGFAGAALVAWAGNRLGRFVPLLVATFFQLVCFVALFGHISPLTYLGSMAGLALFWNVMNPFQLAILADVDRTGRALALAATVTGIGLAVGPALGALTISSNGYGGILALAGTLALVSLALLLPALRAIQRRVAASQAA